MKFKKGDRVIIKQYISKKTILAETATVLGLTGHSLNPYALEYPSGFITVAREDELELVCKS